MQSELGTEQFFFKGAIEVFAKYLHQDTAPQEMYEWYKWHVSKTMLVKVTGEEIL